MLINQVVIMAPMPSCRLEGSRHPVTQHPGLRGQSPSQNSTPGQTPWANCPSQCQPFQCPPPSTFAFIPLSFFSLSLPSFPPHNSAILSLSTQLRSLLSMPAYTSVGERNETESKELNERPFRTEATQMNQGSCVHRKKLMK